VTRRRQQTEGAWWGLPARSGRRVLYATAFVRALATGATGVLLGLYLARMGFSEKAIGVVISAGLTGAAASAVVATFLGDRIGRRRLLISVSLLGIAGLSGLAWSGGVLLTATFAFLGMVNGMGRDRGAALILEQAALPGLTTAAERTRAFAWYSMLQDIGHALGALLAGLPALLEQGFHLNGAAAHRASLSGVAVLGFVAVAAYAAFGHQLDRDRSGARSPNDPFSAGALPRARSSGRQTLSPRSRAILTRISALFAVDGLAGGFLTTALLTYFFFERFGANEAALGALFFGARVLNALSHLGAAWLARRIGLVNTMVFTHIPSSLLLVTVAFAPSFPVAAALFLLREGLVEMDVPTRQSYVMAVVAPEERTFASGVTNLVRLAAWAVTSAFAGFLMSGGLYLPLVVGAGMKIGYDVLLWIAFRRVRPPEELPAA
jgi:MFS family permease